jgi:hypothetical protein
MWGPRADRELIVTWNTSRTGDAMPRWALSALLGWWEPEGSSQSSVFREKRSRTDHKRDRLVFVWAKRKGTGFPLDVRITNA